MKYGIFTFDSNKIDDEKKLPYQSRNYDRKWKLESEEESRSKVLFIATDDFTGFPNKFRCLL